MTRLTAAVLAAVTLVLLSAGATAAEVSSAPAGVTAIALDGRVELAWQPVAGATGYVVYRGESASTITTQVTPGGIAATTFVDADVQNGRAEYYTVRALEGASESAAGVTVSATPAARSCSAGNAVVLENCFPGSASWRVTSPATVAAGGIEGYATANSVNKGESVDLKINTTQGAAYRIEIYRSGYYGGLGARLVSTIRGLTGTRQTGCTNDAATGLYDCTNWSVSATLTTSASWASGIYLLRLVREDNGSDGHILLAVRDDARTSDLLYAVPFSSYQAYNNYGGKSLYEFNSSGANTAAGTIRAVKVSLNRPFDQARSTLYDWYTRADYALVYWLESQGYDLAYTANTDFEHNAAQVRNHSAFVAAAHDEYYSSAMRSALEQARNAGVSLFFSGSNEVYWRIRFEPSPSTGAPDRVLVCYKETKGGGADPSGPTGTWRDPAGANRPENALLGVQYIGDKFDVFYPLVVSAAEGNDRIYRYTTLQNQPAGTSTSIGQSLVGWEWDARAANGAEPAGVKTLASSPVSGNIEQNYGAGYSVGPGVSNTVKYTAASGALVFATGTNHWSRGLAYNVDAIGEPDLRIQQVTANVLADMNVLPQTPSAALRFDSGTKPPAPATVTATATGSSTVSLSWAAVDGADGYHVFRTTSPRVNGQPLGARANAALLTGTTFTDTGLNASTTYYYVVETVTGAVLSAPSPEASATTAALPPPTVTATLPADGATSVNPDLAVRSTFSRAMDAASLTTSSYTLTSSAGGASVSAAVSYDAATKTAVLTPTAPLAFATSYTARLAETVRAPDGVTLAAPYTWSFTTAAEPLPPPNVTAKSPAAGATAVPRNTAVRATFSRAMDPATIGTSSFTLRTPAGALVAASVTYDAATTSAILTPTQTLASTTTYTARLEPTVKAADGTALAAAETWTFTTAACPCSLFTTQQPASQPAGSFEVGVKIKVDQALALTDLRFYKSAQETGSHTGTLWSASGTRLATVTFAGETASGWQRQALPAPIQLQPNVVYVVSVNTNSRYVVTPSGLQAAVISGPLRSVADGANGVYNDTTGKFPNRSASSSNYFVDVVVSNAQIPLTASGMTPAAGATGVQLGSTVRAVFSKPVDPSTVSSSSFTLERGGSAIPATVTYDSAANAAVLTPSAQLGSGLTYTARLASTIRAADGTPLTGVTSWSFTTVSCPCSLFSTVDQPSLFANGRFELGVKIKVDEQLALTAIRFFKAPGETGSHVGTVWTAGGGMLARVSFTGETAQGWQSQTLPTPVQLQPNAVYVVSVNANTQYSARPGGLQSAVDSGVLHSVADGANGVYNDAPGAFPSQSYNSTNYYVDGVVDRVTVPLAVASTSPAPSATGVATSAKIRATFSKQVNPASITTSSFTLRDSAGTAVAATVDYDSASSTASLTPSAPLAWNATYTASLAGSVTAADGSTLGSPYTWTFSTVSCPCSLFSSVLQPALYANGRFELGVKLRVDQPLTLTAIRFFKSPQETGTHTGSVWSSDGVRLASVGFSGESSSGWQQQALATPLQLQPGVTYVVSVGINASYAVTGGGLQNAVVAGPLRTVADGANGVFSETLGTFPTQTYNSANYFIDLEAR